MAPSAAPKPGDSPRKATAAEEDPPQPRRVSHYLLAVALVVMLAGLLFGYDQGVISGALDGIGKSFHPSTGVIEIITSWVTLGAMAGALAAGTLAERLGRRFTILLAAAIFVVGALLEALAPGTVVLVVGRLVLGVGVGIASVAAPLYGAENAPARLRGRYVSVYQLSITIGIFLAYLADYLLASHDAWRVMLGISVLPGLLLVVAMLPLGDSPRWYVKVGRRAEAVAVLERAEPNVEAGVQLAAMEQALAGDQQASWGEVFARRWRRALLVACLLAVLQQLTGINSVIYYADRIFADLGFGSPASQSWATLWAIGGVNMVATLVAVLWVDRFGRKPLLLIGSCGMLVGLLLLAATFAGLGKTAASHGAVSLTDAEVLALIGLVVFIASFAFSLGPVVWTVINEIFPSQARGRGVAVATAVNWLAAWLVAQTFLSLIDALGTAGAFALYALFCALTFVFVRWYVPETKGKTLEEIQEMWSDPGALHKAVSTWE